MVLSAAKNERSAAVFLRVTGLPRIKSEQFTSVLTSPRGKAFYNNCEYA